MTVKELRQELDAKVGKSGLTEDATIELILEEPNCRYYGGILTHVVSSLRGIVLCGVTTNETPES
jgi:hypothetical protein